MLRGPPANFMSIMPGVRLHGALKPVTTLFSSRRTKAQVFGPGSTSCDEQSTYRFTPAPSATSAVAPTALSSTARHCSNDLPEVALKTTVAPFS